VKKYGQEKIKLKSYMLHTHVTLSLLWPLVFKILARPTDFSSRFSTFFPATHIWRAVYILSPLCSLGFCGSSSKEALSLGHC